MFDINKLELPSCPYCGEKLLYLESFLVKNKSTYECKCCDCFSEVVIKIQAFNFLLLAELISIIIFLFSMLFGGGFCLFGILAVVFIFTCFYIFSPFSIKLCKIKNSRLPKKRQNDINYQKTEIDSDREIYSN